MIKSTTKVIGKKPLEQIAAEWKQAALAVSDKSLGPVGEGWFTFNQLISNTGLSDRCLRNLLRMPDRVERFRGWDMQNGRCCQQCWYRLKPIAASSLRRGKSN